MAAKLIAPKKSGGCSWGGQSYTPDKKGVVTVPDEAVRDLLDHGFTLAEDQTGEENAG